MARAALALEDGTVYFGESFGGRGTSSGEVCFNTSMTGYQEILTDPSYRGQILCMTTPQIGNYGVNRDDVESAGIHMAGFVVREVSRIPSNFTATGSLQDYLASAGVIGLSGIDTRALVRRLRIRGAMTGVISSEILDGVKLVEMARSAPALVGRDLVAEGGEQSRGGAAFAGDQAVFPPGLDLDGADPAQAPGRESLKGDDVGHQGEAVAGLGRLDDAFEGVEKHLRRLGRNLRKREPPGVPVPGQGE